VSEYQLLNGRLYAEKAMAGGLGKFRCQSAAEVDLALEIPLPASPQKLDPCH
jgi:hypothetical protein